MLGVVIFVMAGPPCETWSAARFLALEEDGAHGPRPLRTQQQLWGLTCLRKAEANSSAIGNALLRATLRMFFAAMCNSKCAVVMEHPRKPTSLPTAPSSWMIPELRFLASLPNCNAVDVDQCMTGAPSKKPTTLLCLQVNNLQQLLDAPLLCDGSHVHSKVLRGLDADGLFRTAPAKQYPQGLCSILAKLALGQFLDVCSASPPPPPLLEEFADSVFFKFYVPTDHYTESIQSYGADCSVNTGTYRAVAPLPNGKGAAADAAFAHAKASSQRAMSVLSALPNGMQCFDKHGLSRVSFTP